MKKTLFLGMFFLAGFAQAGVTSHWVSGFQQGSTVFNVEAKNGVVLSFSCDFNHSEIPERDIIIYIPGKPGWVDSQSNTLVLKLGEDSYPLSFIGSTAGNSWWFSFWADAAETDSKSVTLSIDGSDIATFTMKDAKKLYESSDALYCIRPS